jgi:sulfur-oxidizing protein SoxA
MTRCVAAAFVRVGGGVHAVIGAPLVAVRVAGRIAVALIAMALVAVAHAQPSDPPRRSGFDDMSPPVQAMQRDDAQNPGMLWVGDGEAAWQVRPTTPGSASCGDCHGDAGRSMRGVAARYPAWDDRLARPLNLQQRINQCRQRHQSAEPLVDESDALLALETYVGHQSRGLPIAPPADPRLDDWRARGAALFGQRIGQLDLSCSQCHDQRAGGRLAGSPIPQAHPTGYPIYRLEWQAIGSLQRRLRNCTIGVRAEPFAAGSDEAVQLELHLMRRAAGMPVETPAVRP